MLEAFTIRLVAAGMTAVVVVLLLVTFRWERGGSTLSLRVRTPVPRGVVAAWSVVQVALFFYPPLVVSLPGITYGTILHFSFPFDTAFQLAGFLPWTVGMALLLLCSRLLGRVMTIDGYAEGHELVTQGPFAVIRHPTYTAHILVAVGTTMLFLSYFLLFAAVLTVLLANILARAEERLLVSPEAFGDAYSAYMRRTGRFLPRLWSRK